jgi:AraC-like DNA-binding protein
MAQTAEQFIHAQRLAPDPMVPMVNGIVARIMGERQITRVADLVSRTGIGERRLRRLFAEFVGVHPKWVIQRYRLHEAAERLAADEDVKLAALALELGYFDQAHFARDFRAIVGRTPAAHARTAASAPDQEAPGRDLPS